VDLSTPEKGNKVKPNSSAGLQNKVSTTSGLSSSDYSTGSKLLDALSLGELVTAIDALREVLPWIRSRDKLTTDKSTGSEQTIKQLQGEKNDLVAQVSGHGYGSVMSGSRVCITALSRDWKEGRLSHHF